MKARITLLVLMLIAGICHAQIDSLYQAQLQKIELLEREVRSLKNDVSYLTHQMNTLQSQMNNLSSEVGRKIEGQQTALDGISSEVNANAESIANTSAALGERIDQTDGKTDVVAHSLRGKTIGGIIVALALLILSALAYLLLRKRINKGDSAIEEIEQAQKRLQDESVKLDSKLVELLESQLKVKALGSEKHERGDNHAFALKVADEIVRIENNIKKMDESMKQTPNIQRLIMAVKRLKDSFKSNGYEIIDLMGTDYNEGMQVKATFITDESLPLGTQLITGVNKLQVNYNGVMIQAADVTVSQNL